MGALHEPSRRFASGWRQLVPTLVRGPKAYEKESKEGFPKTFKQAAPFVGWNSQAWAGEGDVVFFGFGF